MKIVRVVNEGNKPFVGKFDGDRFTIAPRSESLVPYGAMILWLGDPAARNVDERNRHRVSENKRLHVKYGAYENEELWEANKPRLAAFTLDGDEIPTVIADPEGLMVDVDTSDSTEDNQVRRELDQLRAQQARIEEMLASGQLQIVAPTGDADPMPTPTPEVLLPDTPEAAPSPQAEIQVPAAEGDADSKGKDEEKNEGSVKVSSTPPVDEPARVRVGNRSSRAK